MTPSKRTFYKKRITVEFLAEDPFIDGCNLGALYNEAINGGYSMGIVSEENISLKGKQTAKELMKQGSDPSFFQLNEDGSDMNFDRDVGKYY